MSYQSEERYWTDYVRVATPIVGLLLLLGVFWYWANSLIGADSSEPPPTAVLTFVPDDTSTPSPTEEVVVENGTPPPTEEVAPTDTPSDEEPATRTPRPNDEPTDTPDNEQPTDEPAAPTDEPSGGIFEEGETVQVTSGDVRMRAEPSTDAEIVATYNEGVELVVMSSTPEQANDYTWWQVRNDATGVEGWIVEDWLGPAPS